MLNPRMLFLKHLGQTSASPLMLEIEKAEGIYMYSPDGKRYIDLVSGVSVSNTGHCHPKVVQAVKNQADSYLHLMVYGEIIQSPQIRYAELLASKLSPKLNSCFFVNSGSEAVEGALKLAKRYTGRSRMISFRNSYHGSTHGALSVQGSEIFRNSYRPTLPDVFFASFNSDEVFSLIDNKTACVITEPIQAEAGVILPNEGFLERLRERCTQMGALLMIDESQTGFGRTGSLFASERYGVTPDILVLAKALGGGMPLGAFIAPTEIMSALTFDPPLGHITTFGGHPVSCAAGMASLNVILDGNLHESALWKSELFRKNISNSSVKEIRGAGLLMAVETDSREKTSELIKRAPEFGILLDCFLFCPEAFRIAPPLTISEEEIKYSCDRLNELLGAVCGK